MTDYHRPLTLSERARFATALGVRNQDMPSFDHVEDLRGLAPKHFLEPMIPGQDMTMMFDRPTKWGEPAPKVLPYIDPVADWWAENPDALEKWLKNAQ